MSNDFNTAFSRAMEELMGLDADALRRLALRLRRPGKTPLHFRRLMLLAEAQEASVGWDADGAPCQEWPR